MHRVMSRTSRLLAASALFLALALGCTEDTPLETPTDPGADGPTLAPGTSLGVNLDQCANLATPDCEWQNGDLNKNNSAYAEGDVVPFRLAIEGLTPGSHSIHINTDFTAGGHKAYDFLASVDVTESVDLCAVGGGAVSSLCPSLGAADAEGFPADAFNDTGDGSGTVDGAIADAAGVLGSNGRELRIYGGTITQISGLTHAGNVNGNSTVDMLVTFNATGSAVLLVWGGHLAKSSYWKNADNTADGAGEVSGAPWHMRTQQLDNSGNKNQDRSIQPSAIVETHPAVTISKTPNVTQVCSGAGTQVTYTYVVTNTGDVALDGSVSDDNGTPGNTADDIAVGTFTGLAPSGTRTFTSTRTINATTTNIATVTATDGTTTVSNTATATVTAVTCSISLTKTPNKTDVCTDANNSVTYTYVITNNAGNGFTASGTIVDDNGTPLNTADDITVGTFTNLAAGGGQQTFTSTRTITANTTNIATASATFSGGGSATTTATATVTAHSCAISLTKTPSTNQVCNGSNTSVTYTYVVKNEGDFFPASGSLVDDNGTPANTADDITVGSWGPLAPGATATLTSSRAITATTTNIATASGTSGGKSVSATATATVTGVNCTLSLTKTPDKADVCTDGNNSVTYTYVVTNNAPFAASGTVTDDNGTPGNTADDIAVGSFSSLAASGGTATLTHTRTITATTTNIATANATFSGGGTASTTATATVTAHTCTISLTKTPSTTSVCANANTSVTYTYVVTNTGDFFPASGSLVDDNGTPGNTGDDITVGSWGPLAAGASATLTNARTINATTTNIATASGTSGGKSVSATANATVTARSCGTGLLAPTQTTCEQFASGTSPDLEPLLAGIKNQKINNIAPGVFFFYASITPQSTGNLAISVSQTVSPNPFSLPKFQVAGTNTLQAFVYTFNGSSCTKVLTLSGATDPSGTLSATAGTTYIIGVKYGTGAPVGSTVGNGTAGQSLAFYSFAVGGFASATDGADLFRKNTTP